jgi:hypothetical protein
MSTNRIQGEMRTRRVQGIILSNVLDGKLTATKREALHVGSELQKFIHDSRQANKKLTSKAVRKANAPQFDREALYTRLDQIAKRQEAEAKEAERQEAEADKRNITQKVCEYKLCLYTENEEGYTLTNHTIFKTRIIPKTKDEPVKHERKPERQKIRLSWPKQ